MNEIRPRRLRNDSTMRNLTRETRVSDKSLILPLFIKEDCRNTEPIEALEGHYYYNPESVCTAIEDALKHNIQSVLLFGLPKEKDEFGSGAYDEEGAVQAAIRRIKKDYPQMMVITDVCMCEYTSHGHCGIIKKGTVDNDETLPYLSKIALSHVAAGADMVAPSDMMDGRVKAIRTTLDEHGYYDKPILSYTAKYASAFYGPFREVAKSAPSFGDRKSYQMDYHNSREALKEAELDIMEGADILMVKPALSYLDIIKDLKSNTNYPICAYSVSGEYAMLKAAAKMGYLNEYNSMCESTVSIFRAGADMLITYYAMEIADAIRKGDIG